MEHNILWTGREYYSLENCLVHIGTAGISIRSTIIGSYRESIYHVSYKIETNTDWETRSLDI
jgi:hypothetical protein